jgi:alkanesulfonate monooxygenase SsuD/methylene tetrahydromethanopterin reductase-like flavin-dependent oxidoreductase (luciferase family)
VRLGVVILPAERWSEQRHAWRRAEEIGFDHAWTYDHLSWRTFHDAAWFGAVPTLTAAALATSRIRIGPLVASPNFRHPVPFAKELITLDDISGGRVTLGLGAGGVGWDATALGQEPWSARERTERFAEFVELTDRLLRAPAVTHAGRYYAASDARTHPGCVQQPRIPFAIAATGARGIRVAATYGDAWVTTGDRRGTTQVDAGTGAAIVREQIARLEEACAAIGRDAATIDRIVHAGPELDAGLASPEQFRDTLGRYAEVGVTDFVVPWPRPDDPYRGDLPAFERTVA